MVSIATVLERLKDECKKDITKTSSSISVIDCDYNVVSIKLFGENYLIKKVSMASVSSYKVGWVLNNQINSCMKCDVSFGMFQWRHHCRSCGYLVCERCGIKRLTIPELKAAEPVSRVCKGCFHSSSKQQYRNPMMTTITTSTSTTIDTMTKGEEDYLSYEIIHSSNNNTPSRTKQEDCLVKEYNNNNYQANNNNNNNNNANNNDNDNLSLSPTLTSFEHTTRLYVPKIRLSIQDSGNPLLRSPKAASLRRSSRGGSNGIITDSLSPCACITTDPVSSVNDQVIVSDDGTVSLIHGDDDSDALKRPPVVVQSQPISQMDNLFLCPYTIDIKPRRKSITTARPSMLSSSSSMLSSSSSSLMLSSSSSMLSSSSSDDTAPVILDIKSESPAITTSTIIGQTRTQSTDSSITSIDTKTAVNTKINAIITASIPAPTSLSEEDEVEVLTHSPNYTRAIRKYIKYDYIL